MDQLIWASLSHTRYWYEVGMSKVPAWYVRLIICGVVTGYIVPGIIHCCCSRRGRFSLLGVFQKLSSPDVPGSLGLYHTVCSPVLLPCCVHPCSFSSPAVFSSPPRSSNQGMFCHKIVCVDDDAHSPTKQQIHEQSHFFCPSATRSASSYYALSPAFSIDKRSPCAIMEGLSPCFTKLVSSRRGAPRRFSRSGIVTHDLQAPPGR